MNLTLSGCCHYYCRPLLSLAAAICILVPAPHASLRAATIDNPIPEPIAKSDIRVELQPVAKGLVSPVLIVAVPGAAGRLLVVDQIGDLRSVENGQLVEQPVLTVRSRLAKLNDGFDERGFLGLAFDPDFANAGKPGHRRLFTYTSEKREERSDFPNPHAKAAPDHQSVVASWTMSEDGSAVVAESRKELLRIDQPQPNHNGGMIAFGPDGFLYIGLGDGGAANDMGPGHHPEIGNAQDPASVLGKMLRIDVNGSNSKNGAYGIPQDNPNAPAGTPSEIYAMGLRNPYRFTFDGATLLVGDVGQNKLEFLHRVERGGNYGWRLKEGTFKFNINGSIEEPKDLPPGLIDPVLQYDRDEGTSIIGGHIYRGKELAALNGQYVFGDFQRKGTGRLFHADLKGAPIRELQIGEPDRALGFLVKGFGVDHEGEIYVCGGPTPGPSRTGGVVFKIVPPSPK